MTPAEAYVHARASTDETRASFEALKAEAAAHGVPLDPVFIAQTEAMLAEMERGTEGILLVACMQADVEAVLELVRPARSPEPVN